MQRANENHDRSEWMLILAYGMNRHNWNWKINSIGICSLVYWYEFSWIIRFFHGIYLICYDYRANFSRRISLISIHHLIGTNSPDKFIFSSWNATTLYFIFIYFFHNLSANYWWQHQFGQKNWKIGYEKKIIWTHLNFSINKRIKSKYSVLNFLYFSLFSPPKKTIFISVSFWPSSSSSGAPVNGSN